MSKLAIPSATGTPLTCWYCSRYKRLRHKAKEQHKELEQLIQPKARQFSSSSLSAPIRRRKGGAGSGAGLPKK